jgi:hypothetical protein
MWHTHEMSNILLTPLTEVCHEDVMLKDQKVLLLKRPLMCVVLLCVSSVYVGNYLPGTGCQYSY